MGRNLAHDFKGADVNYGDLIGGGHANVDPAAIATSTHTVRSLPHIDTLDHFECLRINYADDVIGRSTSKHVVTTRNDINTGVTHAHFNQCPFFVCLDIHRCYLPSDASHPQ